MNANRRIKYAWKLAKILTGHYKINFKSVSTLTLIQIKQTHKNTQQAFVSDLYIIFCGCKLSGLCDCVLFDLTLPPVYVCVTLPLYFQLYLCLLQNQMSRVFIPRFLTCPLSPIVSVPLCLYPYRMNHQNINNAFTK